MKLTKQQLATLDNLNPRCEDCVFYRPWNDTMRCFYMSPFLASKATQRLKPRGNTLNCGTEGKWFLRKAVAT